ncbi:hypothetical protein [Corynebacterium callunae]|uniref:Uncharacterized protein n=1 Tax=Corynebacterium callunae DSM 20147 TaxID=1121353 RepID=M1UEN9_9CORY|nr:hypothetical protein [Corynebacterium callunae]AGG66550.1 hypothetical protein H924_05530 [Corynebacterium callunae DSM 20147]
MTEQDYKDVLAFYTTQANSLNYALKAALPEAADEIDQLIGLIGTDSATEEKFYQLRQSISDEALKNGMTESEIDGTLYLFSMFNAFAKVDPSTLIDEGGQIFGEDRVITKAEARELIELEEFNDSLFPDEALENASEAFKNFVKTFEEQSDNVLLVSERTAFQNCIDGKSGTFRLYSGGAPTDTPRAGGSSFGSS